MSLFHPSADWAQPVSPVRPSEAPTQAPEQENAPAFFIDDQRESQKNPDDEGENEDWRANFDTHNGQQYRGCKCGNRAKAMSIHKSWMDQKPGDLLILTFEDGEKREIPYTNIAWMMVYKNKDVF